MLKRWRFTTESIIRNVANKNQIALTVNGKRVNNFNFNAGSGALTAQLDLVSGSNKIRIKANNDCGTAEDNKTITFTAAAPPCDKPSVNITSISTPVQASPTSAKSVLKAKVKEITSKNQVQLLVNNKSVTNFSLNTGTGQILATLDLKKGNNSVKIRVQNDCGQDEDARNVNFQAECPKPQVKINNVSVPAATPMNPNSGRSSLSATVRNVANKNQIALTVNGKRVNNFSFNAGSGALVAQLDLVSGSNKIRIQANNDCGTAEDNKTVSFTAVQPKPQVKITKPSNNSTTKMSSVQLSATVKNVTGKNQIQVKVNGRNVTNFSYNARGEQLIATVRLKSGNNTIQVSASNKGGSASDKVTVKFVEKVPAPSVKITAPATIGNRVSIRQANTTVKAKLQHVKSKKEITCLLNNKAVTNFSYNAGTGVLQLPIKAKAGVNTVKITAQTKGGTASDTKQLVLEVKKVDIPKRGPSVKIDNVSVPAATPMNPNNGRSTLNASVRGVMSKGEITITLNGKKIGNFNFSPKTGKITAALDMVKGKNTIIVKVMNKSGKAQDTKTVTF